MHFRLGRPRWGVLFERGISNTLRVSQRNVSAMIYSGPAF